VEGGWEWDWFTLAEAWRQGERVKSEGIRD